MRDKAIPEASYPCGENPYSFYSPDQLYWSNSLQEWVSEGYSPDGETLGISLSDYLKERYVQMPRELSEADKAELLGIFSIFDPHLYELEDAWPRLVAHFEAGGEK